MDLSNLGLFKLMSRKMDWQTQRNGVLAENIANADTPMYKPNELKPFSFRDALADSRRMAPTATNAAHLSGTVSPGGMNAERRERDVYETSPDGNAVVLEEQMMKLGQNTADYQTVLNLYRKQVSMIRTALRGAGG